MDSSPVPPMDIDREDLWLLGLVGTLVIGGIVAFAWTSIQTDVAEFTVSERVEGTPVDVTVEQWNGTGFKTIRHRTISGENNFVYRTTGSGRYRVTLTANSHSCNFRVITRSANGELTSQTVGERADCPGWFTLRITEQLPWNVPT